MATPMITLVVNDPLTKRCEANVEVAMRVQQETGVDLKIIKKGTAEYRKDKGHLPCPSVLLNGRIIARNDVITYQGLKALVMSEKEIIPPEGSPGAIE